MFAYRPPRPAPASISCRYGIAALEGWPSHILGERPTLPPTLLSALPDTCEHSRRVYNNVTNVYLNYPKFDAQVSLYAVVILVYDCIKPHAYSIDRSQAVGKLNSAPCRGFSRGIGAIKSVESQCETHLSQQRL
jgi:hypothetical protein